MGQQVDAAGELKVGRRREGAESAVPDPKPGELAPSRLRGQGPPRAAPVGVAKPWDDLGLGVISQSNSVIAGSLRNISKYGRLGPPPGVGALGLGVPRPLEAPKTGGGQPTQT
jgi:hypothetical protein